MAEDHGKEMIVDDRDRIGNQNLDTEAEHLRHRLERDAESRTPGRGDPKADRVDRNGQDILDGDPPIGKAFQGKDDGDEAGDRHGDDAGNRFFLDPHLLHQVGVLRRPETADHKTQEGEARQPDQLGIVEETGDGRCREEQDQVDESAQQDVEPEDGIVVVRIDLPPVQQSAGESAVLDRRGHGRKDGQHSHDAEIRRVKDPPDDHGEHQTDDLQQPVAQSAPE